MANPNLHSVVSWSWLRQIKGIDDEWMNNWMNGDGGNGGEKTVIAAKTRS